MQTRQIKERPLYRELLRAAWDIAKKRRELWPLGLFAAFLMMNGGAFEFVVRAYAKISSGSPYDGVVSYALSIADAARAADPATLAGLFLALILGAAVFAAFAVMATVSGGGLLAAAAGIAAKKRMSARQAFSAGAAKTGPLLMTQLAGRFVIFIAFILAATGSYLSAGSIWNEIAAVFLFVLFAATALVVSFLMIMTDAGIMIGKERWIHAAHDACRFLGKHWLISIEMIGLVFAAAVGTALAAGIAALLLLIPFTLALFAAASLHSGAWIIAVSYTYQIIVFALIFLFGAVLSVFERAAWGFLYVRLSEHGATPKLERLWRKARSKIHGRIFRR